ncbi:MAG: ATP-binding cassette domain-containing protein, partial [Thiovulaceae bacterium]|nr:ATP-binding cassette domain-containing protein [Sulfurimonadaceae bacterium]
PKINAKLQTLHDVGLGYITLGQNATTLSGGEAQRIKLAKELSRRDTGQTLYILDEPTTGLHFDDVNRLTKVLHHFVELGNSVLVIEHNLDMIKNADYIIDMGPEGGSKGGKIIALGSPEVVASESSKTGSYTGEFLAKELA